MALGCASHAFSVTDRSGIRVIASGVLTEVEWHRVLDDVSTARVTVQGGVDCCGDLGDIRTWRMSLNLYLGDQFVWSGPITQIEWTADDVTIQAVDIVGLLDRRVPHQDFTFTGTDLAEIARQLIDDGFAPDDPGHTVTVIGPSGVTGGRQYATDIGQTGDHLRDLAETGLDFTAVGNNIVLLPETFCEVVGRLSDQDMPEGLSVAEDGTALATRWVVAGQDATVEGTAGGTDSYYGLLERYVEQTSITDSASAQAAAEAKLRTSRVAPVFIDTQAVTLAPTAPVDITQLVPGWCLDITSAGTCRDITQRLKIVGVDVVETGGDDSSPGQLQVQVQVAASGAETGA
jgi:hypothetical protein